MEDQIALRFQQDWENTHMTTAQSATISTSATNLPHDLYIRDNRGNTIFSTGNSDSFSMTANTIPWGTTQAINTSTITPSSILPITITNGTITSAKIKPPPIPFYVDETGKEIYINDILTWGPVEITDIGNNFYRVRKLIPTELSAPDENEEDDQQLTLF